MSVLEKRCGEKRGAAVWATSDGALHGVCGAGAAFREMRTVAGLKACSSRRA